MDKDRKEVIGELLCVWVGLTYMTRPHCRVRERVGLKAIENMKGITGMTDEWTSFAAVVFAMIGAPLERRRVLYYDAIELVQEVGYRYFPEMRGGADDR